MFTVLSGGRFSSITISVGCRCVFDLCTGDLEGETVTSSGHIWFTLSLLLPPSPELASKPWCRGRARGGARGACLASTNPSKKTKKQLESGHIMHCRPWTNCGSSLHPKGIPCFRDITIKHSASPWRFWFDADDEGLRNQQNCLKRKKQLTSTIF